MDNNNLDSTVTKNENADGGESLSPSTSSYSKINSENENIHQQRIVDEQFFESDNKPRLTSTPNIISRNISNGPQSYQTFNNGQSVQQPSINRSSSQNLIHNLMSSLQVTDCSSNTEPENFAKSTSYTTNETVNNLFEDAPAHHQIDPMIHPCTHDYPFLHKIFQALFANQNFFDCAFFETDNSSYHLVKQMTQSRTILYQLMIRQMLFDGYGSVAEALQQKIDPSISAMSLSPENTLYKLFNILFYIEMRSKTDVNFSNFLNWFLSFNLEDDRVINNQQQQQTSNNEFQPPSDQVSEAFSAVESTSVIYETDSEGQVSLQLQGTTKGPPRQLQVAYKFGQIGNGPGCLDTPHGFCLGIDNDIVIADTNNHRICVFTLKGQFKFSFGQYGTENGKLNQPRKIAMMPPAILTAEDEQQQPVFIVCDRGTRRSRMQVFSIKGEYIRLVEIPPMDIVSGLTTTQDRKIIVVDSVRSGVLVLDEFGGLLSWFTCAPYMMEPSDIAVHNKHFYICDFKGHCVSIFNKHGVMVNRLTAKLLKFPNGIDVSDYGDIICGDSHGNRFHISVFNEHGELEGDYDCPFVKVSRCCGLRLSREGLIVTLAKNNNHAVVMNAITIKTMNN